MLSFVLPNYRARLPFVLKHTTSIYLCIHVCMEDVSVFKSLKDHFSKAVRSITFAKKDYIVTKRDFSRVVKSPFEKAFSIPNVKAGFAKCGVYPFNRNVVPIEKMVPSVLNQASLSVSSGSPDVSSNSQQSSSSEASDPATPSSVSSSPAIVPATPPSVSSSSTVVPVTPISGSSSSAAVPARPTPSDLPVSSTPNVAPLNSTPTSVPTSISSTSVSPTNNPLVMAGLIPADMAHI